MLRSLTLLGTDLKLGQSHPHPEWLARLLFAENSSIKNQNAIVQYAYPYPTGILQMSAASFI